MSFIPQSFAEITPGWLNEVLQSCGFLGRQAELARQGVVRSRSAVLQQRIPEWI